MQLLPLLALLATAAALPAQVAHSADSLTTEVDAVDVETRGGHDRAHDNSKNKKQKPISYKYPGKFGQDGWDFGYAQVVRVGDMVTTTGQGGWDPATGVVTHPTNQSAQIEQAFSNVELALKTAGAKWNDVYHIRSFHMPLTDDAMDAMAGQFAQYLSVKPVWTAIGVTSLGIHGQLFEIDVEAWAPK